MSAWKPQNGLEKDSQPCIALKVLRIWPKANLALKISEVYSKNKLSEATTMAEDRIFERCLAQNGGIRGILAEKGQNVACGKRYPNGWVEGAVKLEVRSR